jgi:NAD(P)-dependent dehydrogenase (short-subunit alcohol dehydrogenase family)
VANIAGVDQYLPIVLLLAVVAGFAGLSVVGGGGGGGAPPEAAVGDVIGLTPLGRLGEVADMADAVVFLASDAARFVTGAGLPVDGGMGM